MPAQNIIDTWNGYTNFQSAQEFMDISRQQGYTTVRDAVSAYVDELCQDRPELTADQLRDIERALETYLAQTRGTEWN